MIVITFFIKIYIVLLLLRSVITSQEINFNPLGRMVGSVTTPVLKLMNIPTKKMPKAALLLSGLLILISALLSGLFDIENFWYRFSLNLTQYFSFLSVFFVVCLIMGSFTNKFGLSAYIGYFFRLASPWVKFTKTFIPINSSKIIFPAMLLVFGVYLVTSFAVMFVWFNIFYSPSIKQPDLDNLKMFIFVLKQGLFGFTALFFYAAWIMIVRALMSWVAPDVRNPVVQLVYVLTEPILAPFRKFIPVIGVIDLSAFAAIIALNVVGATLENLIKMI